MDYCDINVRVLFDFAYTTKYGRHIKITSGERLLLIKKTNDDWWQVIRSSDQRPFFVPASYVQEIETNSAFLTQNQSKTKCSLEQLTVNGNPSSSTSSLNENLSDIQQNVSSETLTEKLLNKNQTETRNLKKEISGSIKNMTISSTMSSSGYNSFSEELPVFDEENRLISEVGNVKSDSICNKQLDNGTRYSVSQAKFDNTLSDVIGSLTIQDKLLSCEEDKMLSSEVLANEPGGLSENSKYSKVVHPSSSISENIAPKVKSNIPPSDSLENLSLQIEIKTNLLRTTAEKVNSYESNLNEYNYNQGKEKYDRSNLIFTNHENNLQAKEGIEIKPLLKSGIKNLKEHETELGLHFESFHTAASNRSLHYQGSFKVAKENQRLLTKSSSEKQLRTLVSHSEGVKLPKCTEDFRAEDNSVIVVNDDVHSNYTRKVDKLENSRIYQRSVESLENSEGNRLPTRRHYSFGNDAQMSSQRNKKEKTTSLRSLDSVFESDFIDFQQNKHETKEFVGLSDVQDKHSEKSSTDSLLDVEYYNKQRKISCGTSDSVVPTDGEDLVSSESDVDFVDHPKKVEETRTADIKLTRKPLTRNRRVFSKVKVNSFEDLPPSPTVEQAPTRRLDEDWNEFNTEDGRTYFFNYKTKERTWKPPRKSSTTIVVPASSNAAEPEDMFVVNLPLPSGWRSEIDPASGQTCYINVSGAKWFSSTDGEGRVYFFEENSNNSSWNLPEHINLSDNENEDIVILDKSKNLVLEKTSLRNAKTRSLILARHEDHTTLSNSYYNWPKLRHGGNMCILKEGPLNKTKITEHGKKVRKNWTSTHAVLTELQLLFFKDNKGFSLMMNGTGGPEISVDLNGAIIYSGEKVSSRKHVYMLSTVLGLQVLIQCDCSAEAEDWLSAIQGAINKLPIRHDATLCVTSESPTEESKLSHIKRSRSLKLKQKSTSIEDMSANITDGQNKIRERLKKFFHRRPTVELLMKKGIWKDEPVFGCLLEHVCKPEPPRVPEFVQRCINCIEQSEENMKADGLYRASGNLSQVQRIRLQVDQNIYSLLDQEEDVHVLTGALKLFFRELKAPLIPFKFFNKALRASTDPNRPQKIKELREIVKALPPCNYDTLKLLLQHLLRVSKYQEHNRMQISNLAIVFGPTLMWPEQESRDMAVVLMQQNLVIECFLTDFHEIFH